MSSAKEYLMSGCKVKFPVKAYPSQVAMMSKIITSLQRSNNCLLESPTGSGKSLALLCASLAWQESEQKKVDAFNELLAQATTTQDPSLRDALLAMAGPGGIEFEEDEAQPPATAMDSEPENAFLLTDEERADAAAKQDQGGKGGFFVDDDNDFEEPSGKRARANHSDETSSLYHLPPPGSGMNNTMGSVQTPNHLLRLPKKQKVPIIYFGTRTHKQVAQIVRELNKTAYKGVRLTILGSRDHTCIHPTVSKSYNKNQDCQDLLDRKKNVGCRFKDNVKSKLQSHSSLRHYLGHNDAWDIEDIVKVGKRIKICPYFAVRELRNTAQLVICPYNYLVDPKIRKSMEINLKNQIIVLDEAHNIEDSARDAVSGSFNIDDIANAMKEFEKMVEFKVLPEVHQGLADFCSRICAWLQRSAELTPDYSDFSSSSKIWTGTAGLAEWNALVFPPESMGSVRDMLIEAVKEQSLASEEANNERGGYFDGDESSAVAILSKKASDLLDSLFGILDLMVQREATYRDDYRMAVVQSQVKKKSTTNAGGQQKGWRGRGESILVKTLTAHFWCLNPAVCFDDLKNSCKSIVLTSGTLSPIVTFASELDVKFPVTLEANHVIDKQQVWVGTLSHGPTGVNLNATYRNTETLAFQDEIGRLVVSVCEVVPHGVLVFLPSYKMLDNLTARWQATGTWANIQARKRIVAEPRSSDQLDGVMSEFYGSVEGDEEDLKLTGALFMAVCRGKVSEGLDFADNNARAVICVGIPFPNVKDSLVDLKRKYNDHKKNSRDPNVLSGSEWYEIQAFRALNQALGRCIRHRNDWGAILMVDDRYSKINRYVNSLSRWVRGNVVHYSNANVMKTKLSSFTEEMTRHDLLRKEEAAAEEEESRLDEEKKREERKHLDPQEGDVSANTKEKGVKAETGAKGRTKKPPKDKKAKSAWISSSVEEHKDNQDSGQCEPDGLKTKDIAKSSDILAKKLAKLSEMRREVKLPFVRAQDGDNGSLKRKRNQQMDGKGEQPFSIKSELDANTHLDTKLHLNSTSHLNGATLTSSGLVEVNNDELKAVPSFSLKCLKSDEDKNVAESRVRQNIKVENDSIDPCPRTDSPSGFTFKTNNSSEVQQAEDKGINLSKNASSEPRIESTSKWKEKKNSLLEEIFGTSMTQSDSQLSFKGSNDTSSEVTIKDEDAAEPTVPNDISTWPQAEASSDDVLPKYSASILEGRNEEMQKLAADIMERRRRRQERLDMKEGKENTSNIVHLDDDSKGKLNMACRGEHGALRKPLFKGSSGLKASGIDAIHDGEIDDMVTCIPSSGDELDEVVMPVSNRVSSADEIDEEDSFLAFPRKLDSFTPSTSSLANASAISDKSLLSASNSESSGSKSSAKKRKKKKKLNASRIPRLPFVGPDSDDDFKL